MSRSSPPPSNTAANRNPREANPDVDPNADADAKTATAHSRRKWKARFAAASRWLHVYLSMFGMSALLFFSVTGITLNHPDWFANGALHTVEAEGQVNTQWVQPGLTDPNAEATANAESDGMHVAKLEVVEFLRSHHNIRGALADFLIDDQECSVSFKGPGYQADAIIERETGQYRFTSTSHGLVAILNDLHKGRDTGGVWSVFIDVSAVITALISATGLFLLFFLKRRRTTGLVVTFVGTILVVLIGFLFIP